MQRQQFTEQQQQITQQQVTQEQRVSRVEQQVTRQVTSQQRGKFMCRVCCQGADIGDVLWCAVVSCFTDCLQPSGHYLYRQWSLYVPPVVTICTARFIIQKSDVLPTQRICVFCVDLRTNSGYIPIQR
jgi:hypothetical protein